MTTAAELVQQAFYLSKVFDPNEEIPPDYATGGLNRLNAIIDQWSSIDVYIPNYNNITINVLQGVTTYNITPVIQQVLEANIVDSNGVKFLLVNEDLKFFNAFSMNLTTGRPTNVFVQNNDNATPQISVVNLFPVADTTYTATLYCKQRLSEFTYSAQILTLPPFYFLALELQLAKLLSAIYGTDLDANFYSEYERVMVELKAKSVIDMAVLNRNPYLTIRRYLPWGTYVG